MRTLALGFCILTTAIAGCGTRGSDEAGQAGTDTNASAPLAAEASGEASASASKPKQRLATATASKAKDQLAQRLTGRLTEVMQSEGPVAAIRVCSQEANAIAQTVGEELGVRIGRTSQRLRNDKNVPPDWAVELIQQGTEEPHAMLLEDGTTASLMPIKLQPQCVMCHGQAEEIPQQVQEALAELYPNDHATGFKPGELRGWFWVEVPAEG